MPMPRLLSLVALAAAASAGDDLMSAFDPRPTPAGVYARASAEGRWYARADERDGGGAIGIDVARASGSWLGLRGAEDEVWLNLRGEWTGITGDARLASGGSPAGDYLRCEGGTSWRHLLGGGSLVGAAANATLDGQPPAADGMVWSGNASLYGRLGLGPEGRDGLLLALNYDPERVIFASVPLLPLIAWQGQRGPWMLLLGVPFTMISYRSEAWQAATVLGPLPSLTLGRRIAGPLSTIADLRWTRQQWRRADRPRNDDRLELSQWEWSGGLRLGFGPMLGCDLVGGIATARRLGEDADSADARRDGIALEAAPFVAFKGRIAF